MATTYVVSANATTGFVGRCEPCKRPVRGTVLTMADHLVIECPDCQGSVQAQCVYGTVNAMQCDPRCESATGPVCTCGCGGINHGGAWSKPGTMLADELAAYREAQVKVEAKREQREIAKRERAKSAFEIWKAEHADLYRLLYDQECQGGFMADMALYILRGQPLSERQTEVAERIMRQDREREERIKAEAANAKPVPAGKAITVTGEVVSVRVEPSPFGPGDVSKMLVKGDGWKVWVSVPRSLANVNLTSPGNHYGLMNKRVKFTADVEASRDDASFGYGKRPRAAEII